MRTRPAPPSRNSCQVAWRIVRRVRSLLVDMVSNFLVTFTVCQLLIHSVAARRRGERLARVAFFCWPGAGHVNPTLPLVEQLVRRGETVDYYCTDEFRTAIERTGARHRLVSGAIDRIKTL